MNGQLSKRDILKEMRNGELGITPFRKQDLKGASYDITPSIIGMSSRIGMLETVYCDREYPYRYYIYVKAKDTVLAISNEYISVPPYIAGYVVSRVSKVAEGFGHVSTSIDPNWKGALLIALSNPTNKPLKVFVGQNVNEGIKNNSLATLSFHYLNEQCDRDDKEYQGMRMDLLEKICYSNRKGLKANLRKVIHWRRRNFTDFFFRYCEYNSVSSNEWKSFSEELQGKVQTTEPVKHRRNEHFSDYIITEKWFSKIIHWFEKHMISITYFVKIIIIILIILNLLPVSLSDVIKSWMGI